MTKRKNPGGGGHLVRCDDGIVRPMVDATTLYKVVITQEDIDGAVCRDTSRCAIARAIIRIEALRGRTVYVGVGADKAYIQREHEMVRYQVPNNEGCLIRAFDDEHPFPVGFSVTLRPVPPGERLGARKAERGTKNRRLDEPTYRRLPSRHLRAPRQVQPKPDEDAA